MLGIQIALALNLQKIWYTYLNYYFFGKKSCVLTDHVDPDLNRVMTGKIAGFDFGLKQYLTGHNGHDIESPLFFKRSVNAIKRANRNHSRKKKGSRNRERARLDLARKHRKIERQREDFHWKLAHHLTDEYDEIRLEDLNLKGMKALWGRKVSDLGFADFVLKLKYIAAQKGVKIVFIDKWYPSSKTCSACGAINETLNLRDRAWQCPSCDTELDRDRNAAINIFTVGASTLEGEVVRPRLAGLTSLIAQFQSLSGENPNPLGLGVCQNCMTHLKLRN